jgi:hypothetical protein
MAKKKVVKSKSRRASTSHKVKTSKSYSILSGKRHVWGLDHDFIMIVGGAFVLVMLGMMIL